MRRKDREDVTFPVSEDDRSDIWLAVAVAIAIGLCLWIVGCAHTDCCATCPERVQLVPQPPEVITVLPPVVAVPAVPHLESSDVAQALPFDPVAWMRAVAGDLVRLLDALEQARGELEAVNASRPNEGPLDSR